MNPFLRSKRAAVALACAAALGCRPPRPVSAPPGGPVPGAAAQRPAAQRELPVAIDDAALRRRLEATAQKLIADGKTTPMAELIEQLGRTQCTLSLPQPESGTLSPSEVYARGLASVVVVAGIYKCTKCPRWHASAASGFLITDSGAVVTNVHVVNDKTKHTLVAMTHDGRVLPVQRVLAASAVDDAAILQLDAPDETFQPAALAADAPVGTPVSVISHPNFRFYVLTRGIVSRYFRMKRAGKKSTMMQITADFARGSSGGPVLDDSGAVVGFVASTTSVYYKATKGKQGNLQMVLKQCVPAASVLKLIKQADPPRSASR